MFTTGFKFFFGLTIALNIGAGCIDQRIMLG